MRETSGHTSAQAFLRAVETGADELEQLADGLHQILCGALDVVIVRDAFPSAALPQVVDALHAGSHGFAVMPQEDPDIRQEQIVFYGDAMSHNSVEHQGPPIERYLEHAATWRPACQRLFARAGDYESRLAAVLRALAGGRDVDVPRYADGRSYCPSTIRMIPPGHAAPFHIDNYFQGVAGWEYLSATMDITRPINFFAMLSPAERGGQIEIFELRFNDPRAPADGSIAKDHAAFAHQAFAMAAGDLFIFASGRYWHRVSEVEGSRPRWTIGGFLGFARDDRTVFYWG